MTSSSRSNSTTACPSERLPPGTGTSTCRPSALADAPSLHDGPTPCGPSPATPLASHRQSQRPRTHARSGKGATSTTPAHLRLPSHDGPSEPSGCIPLKQTVDAARLVAHSILGLYPVPDLSRCLESPARHLLGQLPLLIWAQKPRFAPACHLVAQHSLHTSLSIPAHPRLYRPVVHSHSCRRLTELPSRPDQPQSMESCTKDNVMLCLVGCLQCRRCIPDSNRFEEVDPSSCTMLGSTKIPTFIIIWY